MVALLVALALVAPPCAGHVAPRNAQARKQFLKEHPCPGGPDRGSTRRCRGYVIDHICPLVCCGLDAPQNMQWQTEQTATLKDAMERTCSSCGPASSSARQSRVDPKATAEPQGDKDKPTARCRDGSLSHASQQRGACSHQGGVARWLNGR